MWRENISVINGLFRTKLENEIPGATLHYEGADVPFILGPHRVFPGRLSITRSFGDIEAKLPEFGGNPKAVIATPEIRSFRLTKDNDFIIIASNFWATQVTASTTG